jgi:uncharacterized membrane protein
MMNLVEPVAVVCYSVAVVFGVSLAILLTAAWRGLDILVTRLVLRQRTRRARATTVVQISGKRQFFQ